MQTENRTWFITGASSGLGKNLLVAVLAAGYNAVAAARKISGLDYLVRQYPDQLLVQYMDVTDNATIKQALSASVQRFGAIDVLVNNAGYGVYGSAEETTIDQVRRQMEVNFFGVVAVTQALLPAMRQQRHGAIVNISSAGGLVGFAGAAFYCASKFALEGMSEALQAELSPFGIKVIIVEPGALRTSFNNPASMEIVPGSIPDYRDNAYKMVEWLQANDGRQPGDPAKAALAIIAAVQHPGPPGRLLLGEDVYTVVSEKLEETTSGIRKWKELSLSIAFEGAITGAIGG